MKDKSFIKGLWKLIREHWKIFKGKQKIRSKQFNSLNFNDKKEYESIEYVTPPFILLYFPFIATFWIAIFVFVIDLGLGIDLKLQALQIVSMLFKGYAIFVTVFFVWLVAITFEVIRMKKRYLEDKFGK